MEGNTPVANPRCEVVLMAGGWYEWRIKGVVCDYGYCTWREAHQAGIVVLTSQERDHYLGRVRGAALYLNALAMALGVGNVVAEKLRRIVRFLEEGRDD